MNLLLVEDEIIVVEDVLSSVNWNKLNITSVSIAYSIKHAKKIFSDKSIDILLCDIELPLGNGLNLLKWVSENYPHTLSIILTCHMDFEYAKRALKLGSLDYLLKPVQYDELENSIQKAIDKIHKDEYLEKHSQLGEFWLKHQPVVIDKFWMDLINGAIEPSQDIIKAEAEDRNIPFNSDIMFLPILISVKRYNKEYSLHEKKLAEFNLKNIATEIIINEYAPGRVLEIASSKFLIILTLDILQNLNDNNLQKSCKLFIKLINEQLNCDISCYIGVKKALHDIPDIVNKLIQRDSKNILINTCFQLFNSLNRESYEVEFPDMMTLAIMLSEGKRKKVIEAIENYLERPLIKSAMDARALRKFLYDFMQMVYIELKDKGVTAHQFFENPELDEKYIQATRSISDMIDWVKYVISTTHELDTSNGASIAQKVKNYIDLNLNEKNTRESIASRFFINADYLDRVFKRETKLSVAKYINQKRIEATCDLLLKTDMNIGKIAISLNFKNLSHFSNVFKKEKNMNPSEYRKKYKKREL